MPLLRRRARRPCVACLGVLSAAFLAISVANGAVPSGFQDTIVASVALPSALAAAPDGRLFVAEKATGRVRVIENGALLATPFVDVNGFVPSGTYFDSYFERGLLGIAFDPGFASNQLVYVYFTVCKQPANPPQPGTSTCQRSVNRIMRFQASGDVALAGSAFVVLDDVPNDAGNHNGGWIGFGPTDGKLYAAVGDGGAHATNAQDPFSLNGKILRVNRDGSIPADNPFAGQGSAGRPEVWALGLRNPYRCRFRADGRLLCGDVGQDTWEEIDVVFRAANYGWPTTEGPFTLSSYPDFTPPIHAYQHNGSQAAIIGGDFGAKTNFPGDHQQSFYFGDFARGVIGRAVLDASGTTVQSLVDFATGLGANTVTDVVAGADGALYYTNYGAGTVRRIVAVNGNRSPIANASASPTTGAAPLAVQFSSAGSSDSDGDPITMTWSFGDGSAAQTAANPSHTYASAGTYTATLTVSDGKTSPGPGTDTVTITVGTPPAVTVTAPIDGATFHAGDLVALRGSATDAQDGTLPSSALHWQVVLHHEDHTHPYIDDIVGSPQSFYTATTGESSPNVAYEVILRATDSSGLTSSRSIVIVPETSDFTLATSPPGLSLTLDGQTQTTPATVTGVVGFIRTLGAPSPQTLNGATYVFANWSDGGAQTHDIVTPATDATYTARFVLAAAMRTPTPAATPTRTANPTPTPTGDTDLTLYGNLIARVLAPTGSGSRDPEVIRDGDVPPVGTNAPARQYDTYDGANGATEDWIGYEFLETQTFTRVRFTEGMHFYDGGWFTSLRVQVRQGGVWSNVSGLAISPTYPGSGSGPSFGQYVLTFPAVSGDAIRLDGSPGGSATFISVGELRVFGVARPSDGSCVALTRLQQTEPNGDYFRQMASDNSIANSDRQLVRNPGPTAICAVQAYVWDAGPANGAPQTTGHFHFEIWSDAGGTPGVRLGGDSSRVDAADLPDGQGQGGPTVFWRTAERPEPTGDFWIVLQSDDLSSDQLAWSAAKNDPTAHSDAAYDAFKLDRNLDTDFNFRVFVER